MAKVKFATDWVSVSGKEHKAGSVAEIDDHDARSLTFRGITQEAPRNASVSDKPADTKEK